MQLYIIYVKFICKTKDSISAPSISDKTIKDVKEIYSAF